VVEPGVLKILRVYIDQLARGPWMQNVPAVRVHVDQVANVFVVQQPNVTLRFRLTARGIAAV